MVQLPPATVARVRMSCYPDQGELEGQSGIWRWVMETYNPGDPETPPTGHVVYDQLVKQALAGQHWMVTPYREILLIHAVQQPLVPPAFKTMGVVRDTGATWADIRYSTPMDGKSTQKFDVGATWDEPVDLLSQSKPGTFHGEAHAFTTPVDPETITLNAIGRHEFGDTKHRMVHYKGTALTRFPEFFPPGTAPLTLDTPEVVLDVPSSARPAVPDAAPSGIRGRRGLPGPAAVLRTTSGQIEGSRRVIVPAGGYRSRVRVRGQAISAPAAQRSFGSNFKARPLVQ
jgi:hypothetical protein